MRSVFQCVSQPLLLAVLTAAVGSGCLGVDDVESSSSHALAQQGVRAVRLDLADDAQLRFVHARLAAAGKTVESEPDLFASLDRIRGRHLAQKADTVIGDEASVLSSHWLSGVSRIPGTDDFEAFAVSTVPGGTYYSYIDVEVSNEDGTQQLSDLGWAEEYGDGRSLQVRATGPIPAGYDGLFHVSSFIMLDTPSGFWTSYLVQVVPLSPGGELPEPQAR